MPDVATQVAVLSERMGHLLDQLDALDKKLEAVETKIKTFEKMADRWKGALLVVIAIGSLIGWIASIWDKLGAKWH